MAMTIFFTLNGLGVVFLLFVLANLWKEGHSAKDDVAEDTLRRNRDWADVVVITHPISHSAHGGLSVIPFRAPDRPRPNPVWRQVSLDESEMPATRISTR